MEIKTVKIDGDPYPAMECQKGSDLVSLCDKILAEMTEWIKGFIEGIRIQPYLTQK